MGNKCPCVSSGGKTSTNNDEYVVNDEATAKNKKKQDKNKKKNASKYSVPPDGLDNSGFEEAGGGNQDGEFTNLSNVAPNGDGPKNNKRGSQEEVHIVYDTDNSERPIDVPDVKYVNRSPLSDPNHNTSKPNDRDINDGSDDNSQVIDTRLRLPSADLDLDDDFTIQNKHQQHVNPAFDDSDSVSSVEEKPDNTKDVSSQRHKIEDKHRTFDKDSLSGKSSDSEKVFDKDSGGGSVNADDIDIDMNIGDDHNEAINHPNHKTFEATFDLTQDNKPQIELPERDTYEAKIQLNHDQELKSDINEPNNGFDNYNHKSNTYEATVTLEGATDLGRYESSDFDTLDRKKITKKTSSLSSSSSLSSFDDKEDSKAKQNPEDHEGHLPPQSQTFHMVTDLDDEPSEHFQKSHIDTNFDDGTKLEGGFVFTNLNSAEDESKEQTNFNDSTKLEGGFVFTNLNSTEDESKEDPDVMKLEKDNYNSQLKDTYVKDGSDAADDDDGNYNVKESEAVVDSAATSENKEDNLVEISMLIEKLEDSLVTDMTTAMDAETLSRNIVEKLDEISALREQAEMELPIETVIEQMDDYEDSDSEEQDFETEKDVLDWYNNRMEELNEAVGMDLLELSMADSLDDETIRPLFRQHGETQSYFIKKRIIELEKLRRKKLVTNQKGLYEPRPESPIELHRPTRRKFSNSSSSDEDEKSEKLTVDDLKDYKMEGLNMDNLTFNSINKDTGNSDTGDKKEEDVQEIHLIHKGATHDELINSGDSSQPTPGQIEESPTDFSMVQVQIDTGAIENTSNHKDETGLLLSNVLSEQNPNKSEKLEVESNLFEESEVNFGVNQFVSPSKSEEDLWYRVESMHSQELVTDDEARQMDILESENMTFSAKPLSNTDNNQSDEIVDNTEIDLDFSSKPVTKAKVVSMYKDEDSDSSDQHSISDDEIVPEAGNKKLPNYSDSDNKHTVNNVYDYNDDEGIYSTPSSLPLKVTVSPTVEEKYELTSDLDKYQDKNQQFESEDEHQPIRPNLSPKPETKENIVEVNHTVVIETSSVKDNVQNYTEDHYRSQSESSDDEPIYDHPSSRPVVQEDHIVAEVNAYAPKELESQIPNTDFEQPPVNEQQSSKVVNIHYSEKPTTMYGSDPSDESEIEELVEKAFEMEKQNKKMYDSDDETVVVTEKIIIANKAKDRENPTFQFDRSDSPELHQNNDEINKLEETNITSEPIVDYLNSSQDQANDLLAEIHAISDEEQVNVADLNSDVPDRSQYDNETIVYNPPVISAEQEQQMDNLLLSLSMQPIPPLQTETEDVNIEVNNIKVSSKETGETYPQNANSQDEEEIPNNHPKLERKQTKEIRLDDSTDTDDTEGLIERAYEVNKEDEESEGSSTEEDPDTEDVIHKYDETLKLKAARPVHSGSDSDSDTVEGSEQSEDEDFEGNVELRETLKDDIKGSLHQMTQEDFAHLMDMYRQEREGLRHMREQERSRNNDSLWEKLKRRKDAVDQHIHEGTSESIGVQVQPTSQSTGTGSGSTQVTSTSVGVEESESEQESEFEEDEEVEEGMVKTEELIQTIQLMDLEIVETAAECENTDELTQLLQEHFELTEKMRRDKENTLSYHRDMVKQKLLERKRNKQFSDSSSEDSCNEENTTNKDLFIDKEMESLKETYVDAIGSRNEITEQDLHEILVQYREDQQDLIRKREYEKLRINEKLRERLRDRKKQENGEASLQTVVHSEGVNGSDQVMSQNQNEISQLDEEFYRDLYKRHAAGELDEEEMGYLIEQHLDKVEEFKASVQKEMRRRKHARKAQMSESLKMREAVSIINAEKEDAERIRNLRQTEKEGVDARLQEKLKKKGQKYDDTPELPPPKRPAKSNQSTERKQRVMQDYENVEYEC